MVIDWSLVQYFVITAVSAFAGASTAFYWERRQKEIYQEKKDLAAGNLAIFLLLQQYNVLSALKKQLIEPFKNDLGAWINMPAIPLRAHDDLRFDIVSLQFLLNSTNPNLLSELLLEEQRFFEALRTVNERSNLHRNELQPKFDALKIQKGQFVFSDEIEAALGQVTVGGLKTLTNAFIEHTDEGIDGIKKIYNKMKSQLEKMFPGKKIINVEF